MAAADAGKEIVPFGTFAIAQFDSASLSEALTANLGGGDFNLDRDLDRVKVPGSGGTTWTVPNADGGEDDMTAVSGIIVAWKNVRAYYATSFDDAPNSPPTCSSDDAVTGHGFPFHKGADEPDGEPITLKCAACPNAQWGSSDKGNGQACGQNRLLFMLTPGDMLPIIVKLPPTSLKAASSYFLGLTRKGKPFYAVQTSITLEKTKNDANVPYSEARFHRVGDDLSPEEVTMVKTYRAAITPAVERVSDVERDHSQDAPPEDAPPAP